MKPLATTMVLGMLLACFIDVAVAQEREDIIWVRDIGNADITLDGNLSEAVWAKAEKVHLKWGERAGLPGSGWRIHGTFAAPAPTDPPEGTYYFLRKGNQMYVAVEVQDKSVGGNTGLWNIDGAVMAIGRRDNFDANAATARNFFPGNATGEYIYSWWHAADTTAAGRPRPGKDPRFHGAFGGPNNVASLDRDADRVEAWDGVTVVNGIANDDTHGDDSGYTMEMRIDLTKIGFDATKAEGEMIPASFTIYDGDYFWPADPNRAITTKVWFQSQWGNNLNEGAAILKMRPDITVNTTALPDVPPDLRIPDGQSFAAPTIDGKLDESVWTNLTPAVNFGSQAVDEISTLPGFGKFYTFWFRQDLNGGGADNDPPVLDRSIIRMRFFHRGTKFYIGAHVEDQAIDGRPGEAGDGFRITINRQDSLTNDNTQFKSQFIFNIDSTGAVVISGDAATAIAEHPGSVVAAASPIGSSTPGDPTDVDEGYQIEVEIDLVDALGYPAILTDDTRWIWFGASLFDGDYFEDPANDYNVRTWWLRERNTGPGLAAYLSTVAVGTGVEEVAELPEQISILGNYPNPFNPVTTLRYALPQTGEVTLQVFDMLGRRVKTVNVGLQAAGFNETQFDASSLASGMYVYRLQVKDLSSGAVRSGNVGRMMLIK